MSSIKISQITRMIDIEHYKVRHWIKQGYLEPIKEIHGSVRWHKFSALDVWKARRIHYYIKMRGIEAARAYHDHVRREVETNDIGGRLTYHLDRESGDLAKACKLVDQELLGSYPAGESLLGMTVFLLIRTPAAHMQEVYDRLSDLPELQEIAKTFGAWDLVVRLNIQDLAALHRIFVQHVRPVDGRNRIKFFMCADPDPANEDLRWSEPSRHPADDEQCILGIR